MNDQLHGHQPLPPPAAPSAAGSLLPFFLALLVMVAMAYGGWTWWRVQQYERERGQAISADVIAPLTEFELTERSGAPFRSADMRGRVWVATYFFTTCPGSCIQLNRNIQFLHDMPELHDATWVSITCDPQNDTPEVLSAYADTFQADPERWLFCRGDLEYTQRVARGMNLALFHKGHQDYAIVIDKAGNMRGVFDVTLQSDTKRLREKLLECLQEEPPQ